MNLEELLPRLQGVRRLPGGRYMARCPAHDDTRASLALAESDSAAILLHCFAGCAAAEVVASLGLELSDLFPDSGYGPPNRRPWSREAVWQALEAEMTLAFVVLCDVAAGRAVDRVRAQLAAARIGHFLEELGHAR
jgi:hypothetical protein